nr:MAG TPA: hypothetical protein [Caudoviricetes sp.]
MVFVSSGLVRILLLRMQIQDRLKPILVFILVA